MNGLAVAASGKIGSNPGSAWQVISPTGQGGGGKSLRILIFEDFPPLVVDPRLVRQTLRHILSNVAKFTGPGGTIDPECRAALGIRRSGTVGCSRR